MFNVPNFGIINISIDLGLGSVFTMMAEGISKLYRNFKDSKDRKTFYFEEDVLIVETILLNRALWNEKKKEIFRMVAENSGGRWSINSVSNRWYKYMRGHRNSL